MADGVRINVIAWFTPDTRDERREGIRGTFRSAYCRLCSRKITSHILIDGDSATPQELAEAREASRRDGETFFAHLQTAHPEQFGEDADNSMINN